MDFIRQHPSHYSSSPVPANRNVTPPGSTSDPSETFYDAEGSPMPIESSSSELRAPQRNALQTVLLAQMSSQPKLTREHEGGVSNDDPLVTETAASKEPALDVVRAALSHALIHLDKTTETFLQEAKKYLEIISTELGLTQELNKESTLFPSSKYGQYLPLYHEQLRMLYKHVTLITDKGSHPYKATKEFLEETKKFLDVISLKTELSQQDYYDIPDNVQKDKASYIAKDLKNARAIIENPMIKAKEFQDRIKQQGGADKAKFEEFAPACEYLRLHLYDEAIIETTKKDKFLAQIRKDAIDAITQVKNNGYVYSEALSGIEKCLAFLDVYERGRDHGQNTNGDCTKGQVSPFYHNLRWRYHANEMKEAAPNYIIFPAMAPLGLIDLLKVRAAPIGIVGVETGLHYVDGYSQTPLEFLVHDYNHSRRMHKQQETIAKEMGKTTEEFAEECQKCVNDLTKIFTMKKSMTDKEKDMIRVQKAIIFEILHEEALPAHPEVIKEALSRGPNEFSKYFIYESQKNGKVVYSKGPAATVVAFVYRKLGGNFYDCADARIMGLGTPEARTREFISEAAADLCNKLSIGISKEVFEKNISDDSGMPLGFLKAVESILQSGGSNMAPLCLEAAGGRKTGFDERGVASLKM